MAQSGRLHVYEFLSGESSSAESQVLYILCAASLDANPDDESFPVSLSLASVLP